MDLNWEGLAANGIEARPLVAAWRLASGRPLACLASCGRNRDGPPDFQGSGLRAATPGVRRFVRNGPASGVAHRMALVFDLLFKYRGSS